MTGALGEPNLRIHRVLNVSVQHAAGLVFLTACFFPWIGPVTLDTSIQPYALLFGTAFCLTMTATVRVPTSFRWYALPVMTAFIYLILANFSFPALRSTAGYITQALICIAGYLFYKTNHDSARFFLGVLLIYILAGLIQLYIDPDFFHFMLSREAGYAAQGGRGVESLAAEPTFLGIHLLIIGLYCWVSPELKVRDRHRIALLAALSAVFISRSPTALLVLCLLALVNVHQLLRTLLTSARLLLPILVVIGVALASNLADWLSGLRFVELLTLLLESPETVIRADQSLNSRVFQILFSLLGFLDHPLLGNGFDRWTSYVLEQTQVFELANFDIGEKGRITSFIGSLLFELGLVALPLFYFIYRAARIYQSLTGVSVFAQLLLLGILLLQSVPVTYPLVPLYVGRAFALQRKRDFGMPRLHVAPQEAVPQIRTVG